jgi:hypothetical protein
MWMNPAPELYKKKRGTIGAPFCSLKDGIALGGPATKQYDYDGNDSQSAEY